MHGHEVQALADNTAPTVSAVGRPMAADRWLLMTMLCYPAVLLVTFILSAATYSIQSSKSEEELLEPTATGPGGKPLPATKRRKRVRHNPVFDVYIGVWARRVFQYITAAVVLTFVADCAVLIAHAVDEQEPAWWCGEERVVSTHSQTFEQPAWLGSAHDIHRSTSSVDFSSIFMSSSLFSNGRMRQTSLIVPSGCSQY